LFYRQLETKGFPLTHRLTPDLIKKSLFRLQNNKTNLLLIACLIIYPTPHNSKEILILNKELLEIIQKNLNLIKQKILTNSIELLTEIVDLPVANNIATIFIDLFPNSFQLINFIIQDRKKIASQVAETILHQNSLSHNEKSIETSLSELHPSTSDIERSILQELEEALTESEMRCLAFQKTDIIALKNFDGFQNGIESNGKFFKKENCIYVQYDTIKTSLIHEVQHSFGLDLSPERPLTLFRYYHTSKNTRPLPTEINDMVRRANYLIKLDNYPYLERLHEKMAHLRQFIALFGLDNTRELLPKLYSFWEKEMLKKIDEKIVHYSAHHSVISCTNPANH